MLFGCYADILKRSGSLLSLLILLTPNFSLAQSSGEPVKVFENRYVIEVNDTVAMAETTGSGSVDSVLSRDGAQVLRSLGKNPNNKSMRLVRSTKAKSRSYSQASEGSVVNYDPTDQFCIDMIKAGSVKSCSPDFEVKALATTNDPSLGSLWGMSATAGIDAVGAWDYQTGTGEVVVAVIDTGVDYTHPDLAANIWSNSGEIPGNNRDDDGNGYIDDVHGWNAVSHNGNPMDDNGHGTHVSGTIGAVGNNALGVVGVNWNVKIMGLKFLDATGSGSLSAAIEAINYMVTMKGRGVNIRVSNNSWGGGAFSQNLYNAILAAQNAGIIFVAAAGNESNDNDANPSYPAGYELQNVISVAAIDSNQNLASFSNYGANTVDIAAPGVSILSTLPGGGYGSLSGTSMATPHVSGALALLIANEPGLSILGSKERLLLTGVPLSSLNGVISTGRTTNVARMIKNETSPMPPPAPTPAPCNYSTSAIPFSPDRSVESAETIIQADEFNYREIILPFSFPFFREQVGHIFVSPNGVIYTKGAPSGMDYQNKGEAPLNAIAALHTDLTTSNPGYGVKVAVGVDRVTVYWLAQTYDNKGNGDIQAWVTIYADGTIDDFVTFENSSVQSYIQERATVGIAGSFAGNSKTYAYNNATIKNGMAVRFVPRCDEDNGGGNPESVVSKIKLRGKKGNRSTKSIEPGKTLVVEMLGTGSGTVQLQASFNNRACPVSAVVPFDSGATLEGRFPKVSNEVSSLKLKVGSARGGIEVNHYRNGQVHRKSSDKKISSRKLMSFCTKLLSSLSVK